MYARRLVALALAPLAAIAMAACGSDDEPAADSTAVPGTTVPETTATIVDTVPPTTVPAPTTTIDLATVLDGNTFVATGVEGYELVPGTQIQVTFEGDQISAAGGCNQMSSTWTLEGDVLVVPPPAMTMMACEPAALMDQDTWLSSVLTSRPTVAVAGDTVTLTADGAVVTLTDKSIADPDLALEGTTWSLDTVKTGSSASAVPAGSRVPTITFSGGTAAVDTGCNTGSAAYQLGATDITLQPMALTRMACTDPAASAVETAMVTTLEGTVTYSIDADLLTLDNGENGLILRAVP